MTSKEPNSLVDHLFRHQSGKMVAIFSKIYGLEHLELIEDSIQDTFVKASLLWRQSIPENPEAWLTQVTRNRLIDLFRQKKSIQQRHEKQNLEDEDSEDLVLLDHEVEDSQLRMLFVACHPMFSQEEQIAFALKTISGFSLKEIAASLLQNPETIKKRLSRARKKIQVENIRLDYPSKSQVLRRLDGVLRIVYLIFNEGFHSTKSEVLVDKELCGEALRLCKLILKKEQFRSRNTYALFALLCYHSSRLDAKMGNNEVIDLKYQDRSKWYLPLIALGNDSLSKASEYDDESIYFFEALIAAEHIRAFTFEKTDWEKILNLYDAMFSIFPSDNIRLARATILLQIFQPDRALHELDCINPESLHQREYLFHGCKAEYLIQKKQFDKATSELNIAISKTSNRWEKEYMAKKLKEISDK